MTSIDTGSEIRTLNSDEIEVVNGAVIGVVAGVAAGALIFLAKMAEETYLAQETAWYAER